MPAKKKEWAAMSEYTEIDHSIGDHTVAELHVEKTTPQGTQFDGVINGHEHRDISVRSVSRWFFGLFCFVVLLVFTLAGVFFGILHDQSKSDTVPSATFQSSIKPAPLSREAQLIEDEKADSFLPTPTQSLTLMSDPHEPLLKLRQEEDTEVDSYGYVKNAEGKTVGVHIPVDNAMTLALQKGFPVEANPSPLRPPAPVSPALEPAEDKGF
jgi:hypothetical protein